MGFAVPANHRVKLKAKREEGTLLENWKKKTTEN